MKRYIQPQLCVIEMTEKSSLLSCSNLNQESHSVNRDYADEALSNKKGGIWDCDNWLSE